MERIPPSRNMLAWIALRVGFFLFIYGASRHPTKLSFGGWAQRKRKYGASRHPAARRADGWAQRKRKYGASRHPAARRADGCAQRSCEKISRNMLAWIALRVRVLCIIITLLCEIVKIIFCNKCWFNFNISCITSYHFCSIPDCRYNVIVWEIKYHHYYEK